MIRNKRGKTQDIQSNIKETTHKKGTNTPYKRKLKIPNRIVDNYSADLVTSFWGPIQTMPIDKIDKDILLDRFSIEIVKKYNFSLSIPTNQKSSRTTKNITNNEPQRKKKKKHILKSHAPNDSKSYKDEAPCNPISQSIIRQRMIIGINQVTRLLEYSALISKDNGLSKPLLILMTNDVRPPTMVMHIPCICRQLSIPIVLIPGSRSSLEIGKILGIKSVSIVAFTSRSCVPMDASIKTESTVLYENNCHLDIDSFVDFAKSKIPSH